MPSLAVALNLAQSVTFTPSCTPMQSTTLGSFASGKLNVRTNSPASLTDKLLPFSVALPSLTSKPVPPGKVLVKSTWPSVPK